ncbi:MAG: DUF29 family protein [Acetobacteraceae bacterium]
MGDLYDEDIVLWSERQSGLLRRIAAGAPVNERPDWVNIIEEVDSVGRSDLRALPTAMDGQPPRPVSPTCPLTLDELLG